MRTFCWVCHRPLMTCFCALVRPFFSSTDFALIVHPYEVKSTVGTAWILRRSILNIQWFRSNGTDLDQDPKFFETISNPKRVPLLLFPGLKAFNLSLHSNEDWKNLIPISKKPLFIILDGTWTQAHIMLRNSRILQSLPRISFETVRHSEYGFKKQPSLNCLSSVEGVHRVIDILASRGWGELPNLREHDQMIEIFRSMVRFQIQQDSRRSTAS